MVVKHLWIVACAAIVLSATAATAAEPDAAATVAATKPATAAQPAAADATSPTARTAPNPDEADLAMLVRTIRANRRALIAVNLGLSEDEASRFWPVYDEYERALAPIGDRMAALIEEWVRRYRTLSNDEALSLIRAYGDNDMARLQVRRSFIDRFAEVLPGRAVARFYQIENKMDAVLRYDLAATIPVVDEKPAAE